MDTSLQTTGNNSLATLSQEELDLLEADRKRMGGSKFPSIPQIRLANKDMKQAPEGEYFIETYKGKDEEPEVRLLGPNPEVTILYKTNTYSYYTPEDGLIAWTSDIHAFGPMDNVTLFVKRDGKVVIDFDGPYPEFKSYAAARYATADPVTGKLKKLLKFKTVLYVLFEGSPYKVFVSNASAAGVDENGNPAFDGPQPQSLQVFQDMLWHGKRAAYEFTVRLGSRLIESSKPYYIMTFDVAGETPPESLGQLLRARADAEKAVYMIDDARRAESRKPASSVTVDELPDL